MNTLPEEIQNIIYKYKHTLEITNVLSELIRYHNQPKIYFCSKCCVFYPIAIACDCRCESDNDDWMSEVYLI